MQMTLESSERVGRVTPDWGHPVDATDIAAALDAVALVPPLSFERDVLSFMMTPWPGDAVMEQRSRADLEAQIADVRAVDPEGKLAALCDAAALHALTLAAVQ